MKPNHTSICRPALTGLLFAAIVLCPAMGQEPTANDIHDIDPFRKGVTTESDTTGDTADPSAEILDAQARIFFATGQTEKAIAVQKAAVRKAEATLENYRKNLDRYEGRLVDSSVISAKMSQMIIPRININNATLEDAIAFLRVKSVELDSIEKDPAKKGFNFVLVDPPGDGKTPAAEANGGPIEARRIPELQLRNIPLKTALKYICECTNTRFEVDDRSITIRPND